MSNTSYYAIRLRSGDMEVKFNTADPAFAQEQLKEWRLAFLDHTSLPTQPLPPTITETATAMSETESIEQSLPDASTVIEAKDPVEATDPKPNTDLESPQQEFFDFAPPVTEPDLSTGFEQPVQKAPQQEPGDDFDDFVDSLISTVETSHTKQGLLNPNGTPETEKADALSTVAIMERPTESDTEESPHVELELIDQKIAEEHGYSIKKPLNLDSIDSLKTLFTHAPKANQEEDYLVLTAYYLTACRGETAVSLREINTELIRSALTPINHALIESTVTNGLIALVPDLTGNAASGEYELTDKGQTAVNSLLQA